MKFHHIGYACERLAEQTSHFAALGYQAEGEVFFDPLQKIRGQFLTLGENRIELLEPLSEDSPLWPFLRKGIKMYHLAYLSENVAGDIARLKFEGAILVVPPQPAVAFAGRQICFLMMRNQLLVELIEA